MKYVLALLSLLLIAFGGGKAHAQPAHPCKLTGFLTDSTKGRPLPYATVALMEGARLRAGAATDEKGNFTIANVPLGNYNLMVSSLGYRTRAIPVRLTAGHSVIDVGNIRMAPESKLLEEVKVISRKALVEDKGDRLVYHAEKDISNSGGSASDVLRKVPMLTVDPEGNVQMHGNGNIKVLINGKPSAIMAGNLSQALRQMPANIIRSVEVITSPGARYDAEGSAGVINIITKKALQGFSGSVNANGGNLGQGIGNNLAVRKNKIGISLSLSAYRYRQQKENELLRQALNNGELVSVLTQASTSDNTGSGGYGDLSLDFDPDSTSRFTLSATFWGGDFPDNSTLINRLTDAQGEEIQAFHSNIRVQNSYQNGQLDLGFAKTFKKPEHEFSLIAQVGLMPNRYLYDTDLFSLEGEINYSQKSGNHTRSKEYTLQTDYVYPFIINSRRDTSVLKMELGSKVILRDISSTFRVEESADGMAGFAPDPDLSNDFGYLQQVSSGYAAIRLNNQRHWMLSAGARLEQTAIQGNFVTTNSALASRYTNLIPSVTISKGIGVHNLKASYTQRIQRPMIGYLNPWRNESDPKNISTGNPLLEPELTHGTELSHSLTTSGGWSFFSGLYWRFANNAIEALATVDSSGVSFRQPLNIARRVSYGFHFNCSGQAGPNWYFNFGGDVRHAELYSHASSQSNAGEVGTAYLTTSYTLPRNFTLEATGNYVSARVNIQGTDSYFYWYGFSVKKELWNKKASLTLVVNNPFERGVIQRGEQSASTFSTLSRYMTINRSARIDFNWRFGQTKGSGNKQSRKIKNSDKLDQ
jgi:ferric enterobactin receptor